jgi:hypothetical protein
LGATFAFARSPLPRMGTRRSLVLYTLKMCHNADLIKMSLALALCPPFSFWNRRILAKGSPLLTVGRDSMAGVMDDDELTKGLAQPPGLPGHHHEEGESDQQSDDSDVPDEFRCCITFKRMKRPVSSCSDPPHLVAQHGCRTRDRGRGGGGSLWCCMHPGCTIIPSLDPLSDHSCRPTPVGRSWPKTVTLTRR